MILEMDYPNSSPADRLAKFTVKMLELQTTEIPIFGITLVQYTNKLDRVHNKNIFDYFPEWEEFWHKSA